MPRVSPTYSHGLVRARRGVAHAHADGLQHGAMGRGRGRRVASACAGRLRQRRCQQGVQRRRAHGAVVAAHRHRAAVVPLDPGARQGERAGAPEDVRVRQLRRVPRPPPGGARSARRAHAPARAHGAEPSAASAPRRRRRACRRGPRARPGGVERLGLRRCAAHLRRPRDDFAPPRAAPGGRADRPRRGRDARRLRGARAARPDLHGLDRHGGDRPARARGDERTCAPAGRTRRSARPGAPPGAPPRPEPGAPSGSEPGSCRIEEHRAVALPPRATLLPEAARATDGPRAFDSRQCSAGGRSRCSSSSC